jgi:predicted DNA binding CopG/RHH family protein
VKSGPKRLPGLKLVGIRLFASDIRAVKALARARRVSYQVMLRGWVSDMIRRETGEPAR